MARRKQEPKFTEEIIEPEVTKRNSVSDYFRKEVFLDIRHGRRDSNGDRLTAQRRKVYVVLTDSWTFLMGVSKKVGSRISNLKTVKSDIAIEPTSEKHSKSVQEWYQNPYVRGILGIVIAVVIVSIFYSVFRVYFGDEDLLSRLMITPAAVFGLSVVVVAFWKILK